MPQGSRAAWASAAQELVAALAAAAAAAPLSGPGAAGQARSLSLFCLVQRSQVGRLAAYQNRRRRGAPLPPLVQSAPSAARPPLARLHERVRRRNPACFERLIGSRNLGQDTGWAVN